MTLSQEIQEKEQRKAILQNYHDKLRSMTSQLTLAEERERRRLAMELHERIGQTLAISKLKLEAFRAAAQQPNKSALNDILHLIDTAIQDTRLLTKELSSPVLDQFGFVAAAEWLIEHMRERHDIRINFSAEADIKTPEPDCQILLYQATRELLMNSIKHAKAQLIEVRVGMESDMLRIRVKDDGIGFANLSETFSESAGSLTGGFGLFSIRERLDHIGGSLSIESKEGKGACITILAPQLKSEKRRRATDRLII